MLKKMDCCRFPARKNSFTGQWIKHSLRKIRDIYTYIRNISRYILQCEKVRWRAAAKYFRRKAKFLWKDLVFTSLCDANRQPPYQLDRIGLLLLESLSICSSDDQDYDEECRVLLLVDENMRSSTSIMNSGRGEVHAEMQEDEVTTSTNNDMHRLLRLYTERPQRLLASPILQVLHQENPTLDSMLNTLLETGEVDTQSPDLYAREDDSDETQSRGLSQEQISLLPISKYECGFISGKKSGEERCVICQMEYKRGEQQMTLPCKHVYHATCGTKWLNINKACPLCQTKVFFDVSKDKA